MLKMQKFYSDEANVERIWHRTYFGVSDPINPIILTKRPNFAKTDGSLVLHARPPQIFMKFCIHILPCLKPKTYK